VKTSTRLDADLNFRLRLVSRHIAICSRFKPERRAAEIPEGLVEGEFAGLGKGCDNLY
jgi:hypothetical protein